MRQEKYIWFDKNKVDKKDMMDMIFLLLKYDYQIKLVDEDCGYVIYFGYTDENLEEKLEWINTAEEFIVTEEEFNERYNDGYNDCLDTVFKELCTMADDDLITAMENAVGYVADRERKEVNSSNGNV